ILPSEHEQYPSSPSFSFLSNFGRSILPLNHGQFLSFSFPSHHGHCFQITFSILPNLKQSFPVSFVFQSRLGHVILISFPSSHRPSLPSPPPILPKLGQTDLPPSIRWAREVKFKMK